MIWNHLVKRGRYRMRGAHQSMHADREHHHDMYVAVEFEFEKCPALSLF